VSQLAPQRNDQQEFVFGSESGGTHGVAVWPVVASLGGKCKGANKGRCNWMVVPPGVQLNSTRLAPGRGWVVPLAVVARNATAGHGGTTTADLRPENRVRASIMPHARRPNRKPLRSTLRSGVLAQAGHALLHLGQANAGAAGCGRGGVGRTVGHAHSGVGNFNEQAGYAVLAHTDRDTAALQQGLQPVGDGVFNHRLQKQRR
jgi:hypothetical protein